MGTARAAAVKVEGTVGPLSALAVLTSKRFLEAETRLGPGLKGKAYGAIHDFVRFYEANPNTVAREYRRIAHMRSLDGDLLEIDVSGKDRLIAHWASPRLTLLDVGGHEVVPRYTAGMLNGDLLSAKPGGPGLYPSHGPTGAIFENADSRNWRTFAGEDSPDWMYMLAPSQTRVVDTVRKRFKRTSVLDPGRHFVLGGPGTGKTSVLLSLLIDYTARGMKVRIRCSDELTEFLQDCGVHIKDFRWHVLDSFGEPKTDVLLMDDPSTPTEIQSALNDAYGQSRAVIVAFDPSQLDVDLTDDQFKRLVDSNGVTVHRLRDCYRQKEATGRAAKRVIDRVAESSPYLADAKKQRFADAHVEVFDISNELRFVNAGGVTRVWEAADLRTSKDVAAKIQTRKTWVLNRTPILVVVDEFTEAYRWSWKGKFGGRGYKVIGLKELRDVKGLEYQWVVLVIRESLYRELQSGFTGSTQRIYQQRRLLRIPFTRARDGILTMVLPDMDRHDIVDAFQWA